MGSSTRLRFSDVGLTTLPSPRGIRRPRRTLRASSRPTRNLMKPFSPAPADQPLLAMNRRQFLRGVGACVALPAFGSLVPGRMFAAAAAAQLATTATGAPLRTAFVVFPNGGIPDAGWPEAGSSAADFTLKATLAGIEPVRQHVQVLGGLDHANATGGKDGAGDHARGNGVFLTGVRLNKSATDI